ncbi:alpha/beta fold hydrolase [Nonomuraea candida]|uniref:alpha/beta fold hydrolase n=1 Tax=Nonomuraea candida TaxID=359159 RepID=UPI000693FCD8|nr:alpha/beta fold hydrolase [Nonomuraea candida]
MEQKFITANGLEFGYVEEGEGPLALLLHGFDTSALYRYLMPELAKAGYRAVAPTMRGFAPSQIPADGSMRLADLIADANALHDALGGGSDAVLIGHDWGGFTTWGAAAAAPERWSKVVVNDVPPLRFYDRNGADPERIEHYVHFYFFQMAMADQIVAVDDFAYIDWLWRHWTGTIPTYDPTEDLKAAKAHLNTPERVHLGLELYRQNMPAATFGTPQWEMAKVLSTLPTQPTLYLHGTEDPVVDEETLAEIIAILPPGSDGHIRTVVLRPRWRPRGCGGGPPPPPRPAHLMRLKTPFSPATVRPCFACADSP